MISAEEIRRRVNEAESYRAAADWLVSEGLSDHAAIEIVGIAQARRQGEVLPDQIAAKDLQALGIPSSRPTGQELFDEMTTEEQDALLGPEKAQLVRDGKVELSDLVQRNRQDEGRTFIHPKPLEDLEA